MLNIRRIPNFSLRKSLNVIASSSSQITHPSINQNINIFGLCRALSTLHRSKTPHNQAHRQFISEYKAICKLLQNSNLPSLSHVAKLSSRSFHTSVPRNNRSPDEKDNDGNKKKPDDSNVPSLLMKAVFCFMITLLVMAIHGMIFPGDTNHNEEIRYVSWNEFVYEMLLKGEVEELIVRPDLEIVTIILHDGAIIKNKRVSHRVYHMNIGDMHRFEEKLREVEQSLGVNQSVPVIYDRNGAVAGKVLSTILIGAILLSLIYSTRGMKLGGMNIGGISQMTRAKFTLVDSMTGSGKGVKFEDVAGLKEAKIEINEFVDYLKRPEHYKNLGAKVPKGALLLGPPGCGKTLLAKAVATESNVPFLSMNGSEFIEMIGGLGAARVRDLFKEATKRKPCIVYIDELDAVGRARAEGSSNFQPGGGESEQTLNQLLVEMDGMANREGIIILASTNRADVLDKALLRPGRFDRHILIDLPTLTEREEIFTRHLKNIVLDKLPDQYAKRLAYLTPGFSGADIANVCNEAALHAARHKHQKVHAIDLEYAVERVVGGTEKRNHSISPAEKKIIAYHESGHALIGWLLEHTDALLKVTIVPRTNFTLGFAQYTTSDLKLNSKEQLFDKMCMALGGRAAEAMTFNSITSGAQNDLEKVTKIAYAQVRTYGMSPKVGLVSFSEQSRDSKAPYSKSLKHLIDLESRKIISDAYFRTEKVLRDNKDKLKKLAEELLKRETLNYNDVVQLIGPPPYPKKLVDPGEFEMSLRDLETAAEADQKPSEDTPDKNNNIK